MQYPLFQQQGWPIGSGSAESANTCVVQARLKGPGMHWEGSNVNPLLALRTGVCNDRWDETMQLASRQRLLTRRARRCARPKKKYDKLTQKVNMLFLHLFFFLPHAQLRYHQFLVLLPREHSSLRLLASLTLVKLAVPLSPILGGATPVQKIDVHPQPGNPLREPCSKTYNGT